MPDAAMNLNGRPVYVVDGARTPQLKAKGAPGPFAAADLAVGAGRPLLLRQPFEPAAFDEVVMGCVMPGPDEANIARLIALRLGLPQRTPAWTVQRNCASGMQALASAAHDIAAGRAALVLAGGDAAKKYRLPVLGRIVDSAWAGGDPAQMGLGPANAMAPLLKRGRFTVNDIDYWEINEAFAAQVLAVLAALQDENYCREHLRGEG